MTRVGKAFAIVGSVLLAAFFIVIVLLSSILSHLPEGGASPVSTLRTINTAEITYASTYPKTGFSPSLAALTGSTRSDFQPNEEHAGLLDPNRASGEFVGYRFTYAVTHDEKSGINVAYTVHADPIPDAIPKPTEPPTWFERMFRSKKEPLKPRHFFSDQSNVTRYEIGKEATAQSPALQ